MKKMKHMLAVLLTVIMTLAMTTTAFAAGTQTGNLTVKVNANNTLEGQTIKVYKLFDLTVSGDKYAYTVNETYKTSIAAALGLPAESTSKALYEKLTTYTANSTDIQKFADDFTAAALTEGTAETATSGKLGKVESHKFEGLDYGYYLVYQTGTKEIQSSLVSVDALEETVNLKGEAPSIAKTANTATVEIGQVVTYTITGTIPDTTGYADDYTYKIHDTLTKGLDFVKDADGTAVDAPAAYPVSVQIDTQNATTQNATLSGEGNRTMELNLSQWIRDNQVHKGTGFTVTYYAKVNQNAVVQTNNKAELEYGNNSNDTTKGNPVVVTTPTYPLDIKKNDTKGTLLEGAKFRLYKNEGDAKAANDNAIKVTGSNGSYTVAENQNTESNMDMVTKKTEVSAGYNLHLNGLKAGTYWLVEKEAPAGYNKLTAPIKITITQDGENELKWTVSKDNVPEDDKIIDVENTTGTILPGTGGMGTILFTVVGIALVLIIAASFVISRRKRA